MTSLQARVREGTGKGVNRKLRRNGEVPAVAYGHDRAARPLSINAHALQKLLATINPENTIIDLQIENEKPVQVLIREVQQHPSRPVTLHVDFFAIRAGEKLQVEIPIILQGNPVGVRQSGGLLQEVIRELTVECLPRDIPTSIEIDVENLELGQSIHVSDVTLENATILNDPELVICTVSAPTVTDLPEEEEAEAGEGESAAEAEGETATGE